MELKTAVKTLAEENLPFVKETFLDLHRHPELSMKTERTSRFVQAELERLGFAWERVGTHSIVAFWETGRPGKTLLLRADMDALPLDEEPQNDRRPKAAVSENPGVCHACGHDAHTAMLLGACRVLKGMEEELSGKLYIVFEEAEENGGVCDEMEAYFADIHLDGAWAIHVYAKLDTGKISVTPGQRMAGFGQFAFKVHGKGGHSSRPDLCKNPIFVTSAILQNLQSAWVNMRDVTKVVPLSVGIIQSGTKPNIIPETCEFWGSIRYFEVETGRRCQEIIKQVTEDTAKVFGCEVERFGYIFGENIAETDPACSALATRALSDQLGAEALQDTDPWYASETFAIYTRHCPGVFAFLGCKNEEAGYTADHHHPRFEVDPDCLLMGVEATSRYALDFLRG